jgi:hypothetical protein
MSIGNAGASEVWQARIGPERAAQLRFDGGTLGLTGRAEIVTAALRLLHRQVAEERMARSVDLFYGGSACPLPIGVLGDDPTGAARNSERVALRARQSPVDPAVKPPAVGVLTVPAVRQRINRTSRRTLVACR